MTGLIIRRMEEEDLQQITEIEKKVFSQPWSEKGFRDALYSKDTICLVAVKGRRICGYCGLLQALDEADITNVCVDQEYRNQGIAREMLTKLIRLGEEKGITAFTLEVRVGNTSARHLYESLGFTDVGIRKGFYSFPAEDAVIMWKYR